MDELRRSVVGKSVAHFRISMFGFVNHRGTSTIRCGEPMPVDASLVRVHELPENSWLSCIPRNRETTREPRRPARVPVDAAPVSRRHRRPALQWPGAHRSSAGRSFSGGRQTRVGDCSPAVLAANRPQSRRRTCGVAEQPRFWAAPSCAFRANLFRAVPRRPGGAPRAVTAAGGHRIGSCCAAGGEPSQGALEHPSRTAPTGAHGRAGQRRFPWRRRIRHSRSDDSHLGSDGELPHRARRLGTRPNWELR